MPVTKNKYYPTQLSDITSRLFTNCQEKEARHVAKYGVSIVEFRSMRILYQYKKLTVNQLAQKMSLTSSRITRIIDGLVNKQIVIRTTGEKDRRVFYLSLTPKGEKLANDLIQDHNRIHEEILNNIPVESHQSMIEILKQLNKAVEVWLEEE